MADVLANLLIKLGVDDKDLEKGLDGIPGKLDALGGKLSAAGGKLTRNVTLPIMAAGAGLFALAQEAEEAQAKLGSSFDSMGAAAWTSVDALNAQAEALQSATTFDDEGIANFQSVLLTFGNVTGDVFTDATKAGLDMSAKLGTDLQSSAIQVGKALNDPIKGVTALTRVGVSFTQQQKEQIAEMQEAGDLAGAQAVILGELEKQFGGTAEAMAKTNTGQAKQAMNALANAGESIAMVVAPAFGFLARTVKSLAEGFSSLPGPAKTAIAGIMGLAAVVGPLLMVTGKLTTMMGAGGSLAVGFETAKKGFLALKAVMMANPWIAIIAATVALVTLIVANWDKIVAFLKKAWDWIKNAASAVWEWVKGVFQKGVDFIKNLFLNLTLAGLIIKHWDKIKAAATAVKDWIVDKWNAVVGFFKSLPDRIGSAVRGLADVISAPFKAAFNAVARFWNSTVGKLSFKVPGWVPGVGGKGFDVPNIPTFHDGGVFRTANPGGEGLALLRDGETVLTPSQSGGTTYNLFTLSRSDFLRELRNAGVEIDLLGWS